MDNHIQKNVFFQLIEQEPNEPAIAEVRFSLRIERVCPPKPLAAFRPSGYQSLVFTPKGLLDRKTMHLVPCNGNLRGRSRQKIAMIRLDIQPRYPSNQQPPGFLPQGLNQQFHSCNR